MPQNRRQPLLELLEDRVVPSVFYDFDVMAQTGGGLTSIENAVSINDSGNVAFVATDATSQDIYIVNGGVLTKLSPGLASNTYGRELQLNDSNQVAAINIFGGNRRARIWDGDNPGASTLIASSSVPRATSAHFDALGNFASIANDNQMAFGGLESPPPPAPAFWEIHLSNSLVDRRDVFNPLTEVVEYGIPPAIVFRHMAADGDRVVVGSRVGTTQEIVLFDITGVDTSTTIATTTSGDWSQLGLRPGISDDGDIVTFYGDLTATGAAALTAAQPELTPLHAGPGIFASIRLNLIGDRAVIRVAGTMANGVLDPGETFDDANGNGELDAGETDTGPFESYEPDTRVGVTNRPADWDGFTAAYISKDEEGVAGLYTSNVIITPESMYFEADDETYAISSPSLVISVGEAIDGLAGTVQSIGINDPINNKGQVGFQVTMTGGTQAIIRANPHRTPVLFLPGIGGNWYNPATTSYSDWLKHRGVHPDELKIDPILHSYDDLIESLDRSGYTPGLDLFVANYDWRVNPGPIDGTVDGTIDGLTGTGISDNTFEYGVDYLGYWLKQAADAWQATYGVPLDKVDIIAHSTGGLVTRAYIQSAAYGNGLPEIDNFIMLAVPNRGASKAWGPLHDNWVVDAAFKVVLSKILDAAYDKLVSGAVPFIEGPTPATRIFRADILDGSGNPDPLRFISAYAPTIRSLLATYDFLDDSLTGSGPYQNVNGNPAERNFFLLDLNAGLDLAPIGDVRSFVQDVHTSAVFGVAEETATFIRAWKGPGVGSDSPPDLFDEIATFKDFVARDPKPGDLWFEDVFESGVNGGDGTVPLVSLDYAKDDRIQSYRFDKPLGPFQGVRHTEIASNTIAQKQMLNILGANLDSAQISTGLASSMIGSLANSWPIFLSLVPGWSLIVDPVQAVITDSNGKRLGFTEATGVLTEIPGSMYFGGTDGQGWIFGEVAGPLVLELTGAGGPYFVKLQGAQGEIEFEFEKRGMLGDGESFSIDLPLDAPPPSQPPLELTGTPGDDDLIANVEGRTGDVIVKMLRGNDRLTILGTAAAPIKVIVDAGTGNDTVRVFANNVTVEGDLGRGSDRLAVAPETEAVIRVHGGLGNDSLIGGMLADQLFGDDGRDLLAGVGGNDLLDGAAGVDYLLGGVGDDSLFGGAGVDTHVGGEGVDQFDGGLAADYLLDVTAEDLRDPFDASDLFNRKPRSLWFLPVDDYVNSLATAILGS
jgi:Ca2+-binding RTX toxin-like protein